MQQSVLGRLDTSAYSEKGVGPIVVALAFVIAVGGVTAAAILICGWGHIKSTAMDWSRRKVEIVCK